MKWCNATPLTLTKFLKAFNFASKY
jgi:hypothetical protein